MKFCMKTDYQHTYKRLMKYCLQINNYTNVMMVKNVSGYI